MGINNFSYFNFNGFWTSAFAGVTEPGLFTKLSLLFTKNIFQRSRKLNNLLKFLGFYAMKYGCFFKTGKGT